MTPDEILAQCLKSASDSEMRLANIEAGIGERIALVCRNLQNRACVRFIMACALAVIHQPRFDIRKPYTEIGDPDAFSGRTYDERYLTPLILTYRLPCNPTTAFLTPAFRNINRMMTPGLKLEGRPRGV